MNKTKTPNPTPRQQSQIIRKAINKLGEDYHHQEDASDYEDRLLDLADKLAKGKITL